MFCDAHLHLQDKRFNPGLVAVIERAESRGVQRMFCNGTSEDDWQLTLQLAATYPKIIFPFIGIHPWNATRLTRGWDSRLKALVGTHSCGIGEIGLDKPCEADMKAQEDLFSRQLNIAAEYGRPVSLHCVKRWGRLLEILSSWRMQGGAGLPVMIHGFNGSIHTMERLVALGCYLSFTLRLLSPHAEKLRQVFRQTPLDRILLETDSPDQYFSMEEEQEREKMPNEPSHITTLYSFAVGLKGLGIENFSAAIWNNGTIFTNSATHR